jgi:zinc transport system substrate-binding protein
MRYIITLAFASTPGLAEVPTVVTDIPPVHALVAEVMGELGQPELLLTRGADEHDFQLRPSQAGSVARADLVVWVGPELTPWLDSALETRAEGAAALGLLAAKETFTRSYGETAEGEGHDHDHGHDPAEAAEDDHAPDGVDPHAWLDPANGQAWLGLIAEELSRLDPDNAAIFAANAKAAAERIAALDAGIARLLDPARGKPLVTFHDAYGYFADHYGLTLAGSIALGDAASPGARRLAELRHRMEGGAVLCIFPEAQHDPALVAQMAEGTAGKVGGVLDPVGSTLEPGPGAYAALLDGMARTIADCLAEGA